MKKPTFATAINCIDGRAQEPVIKFLKSKFGVTYVDMITKPGSNGILSKNHNKAEIKSIKTCATLSVQRHNSKVIAISGHYRCLGHPVNKAQHIDDIIKSAAEIFQWNLVSTIVGLWVNQNREVEEVIEVHK